MILQRKRFSLVLGEDEESDDGVNRLRKKKIRDEFDHKTIECRRDRGQKGKTQVRRLERRARRSARNAEQGQQKNPFKVNPIVEGG